MYILNINLSRCLFLISLPLYYGSPAGLLCISETIEGTVNTTIKYYITGVILFLLWCPGAKFKEHCSDISRDIPDSLFYCSSGTIYSDIITFLICMIQKLKISGNWKKIFLKGKVPLFFILEYHWNKKQLFFTSWPL